MVSLAIGKEFLNEFSQLDHVIRSRIQDLATKAQQMTMEELAHSKGHNLEHYTGQKDPRARTIRLGRNHRGIVMVPPGADQIVLIDVLLHDDADRWMLNNEFGVNAATGALEVVDTGQIAADTEAMIRSVEEHRSDDAEPVFAHRRDRDFIQLGVNPDLIEVLRAFTTQDQVLSLIMGSGLPDGQQKAISALADHDPVEQIWAEIAGDIDPEAIDPDDLAAAVNAPASRDQFRVVSDEDELADMLAQPLAQWRVYLHHTQERLAYREREVDRPYNGPVRITGGAGTGKTVVAMHRARALAERLDDQPAGTGKSILFTTFNRALAQVIERDLNLLGGSELLAHVDVLNVDRLARQIVKSADGHSPRLLTGREYEGLWANTLEELGLYDRFSTSFVIGEWEQVVLAQNIDSRSDYFRASRAGRGVRLDRRARADVWRVIEAATHEMQTRGRSTFLQLAARAANHLDAERIKPYRHVIVDEAQDLHPAQWRLLRAAVAPGPNDLFIVGDAHQRIYQHRSSLRSVGIDIVGRSHRLRINYRTTRQILRWALAILDGTPVDDLDDGTETQTVGEYQSFLNGAEPVTTGYDTRADMIDALVERVQHWIEDGVDPRGIAVVARTSYHFNPVIDALRTAGIDARELDRELEDHDGVSVATMHRMKGLEARCVAIMDVSADTLPFLDHVTSERDDPLAHAADMARERSLLYVAATRARDDLWVGWAGKPSPFLEPVMASAGDARS